MRKLIYLLMFLAPVAYAQDASLFEQANEAYSEGNYQEAIAKYEQILEGGETSAELHYNLGNSYYKLNEVAPSIYHYERALQLAPNDEDIQNNLQFAQNMTIDEIEAAPQTEFSQWREAVFGLFGTSGWGWAAIVCMVVFSALFILYFFSRSSVKKRIYFIASLVFLFLGIGSVILGYTKESIEAGEVYSIVFSEEVTVRSEPNSRSSEVFTLHAGTKVEVLEDYQGWVKIGLPQGAQGWVEETHLKQL